MLIIDSAKKYWLFIGATIVAGITYMAGCMKLLKWWDRRK